MEEDYIAEDYKRPRAATFTCARGAPVFEPDAVARSDDRCLFAEMLGAGSTSSTGSRAGDSIYSLASPWVPSRQAVMQRTSSSRPEGQAASGGGRALCFNEADAGEEPEQVGEQAGSSGASAAAEQQQQQQQSGGTVRVS